MPEAQNSFAPWRLPVLVPLWIIQVVLGFVFLIAIPIIANRDRQYYSHTGMDARAWMIVVFAFSCLVLIGAEIFLLAKKRLSTRNYLISQWVKATITGTVWVTCTVLNYTGSKRTLAGNFAIESFVLQHPAVIASLYYGSRAFSKYGGNAGAECLDEGLRPNEETPLLRETSGGV